MKISLLTPALIFLFGIFTMSQSIPADSLYFGQTPPGSIPQVFAPGIVSKPNRNEAVITFSPDGTTVFFYIQKYPQPGNPYTMYASYSNNHWSVPDTIPFSYGRSTGEPFFAYNGYRLYMFATNAVNHVGIADLSYSEKQGTIWSDPVSMGDPPNSEAFQYHPCLTGDTSIYFSSGAGDICRSQYNNGIYQNRVILPIPVNHMGSQTWGDPYVSPDESYLILKSIRPEGYGQNDLYISYKKTNGTWTNPKNLGNIINTPGDETSGDITPDGLYMTYGRNNDLWWVSTSFIDSLQYTNFLPYVKNLIPDQTAITGQLFTFTIPDTTFIDDDGNSTLTYNAILANGNPLPVWLTFDTIAGTFSGTPAAMQTLNIKATATDNAGAAASTSFYIIVNPPVSIDRIKGEHDGFRIFPNPSNGLVTISLNTVRDKVAVVKIYNPEGKILQTNTFKNSISLDFTSRKKGIFFVKVIIDNEILTQKICID